MMDIENIHPTFIEALCTHEAFRRLKFLPEQIFVMLDNNTMFVVLKEKEIEFVVACGSYYNPNFESEWSTFIHNIKEELADDTFQEMWEDSYVFKNSLSLILALEAKGIKLLSRSMN